MRSKYICDKCNHGHCILVVEGGEDGDDMPELCPYDEDQPTNWRDE